MTDQQQLHLVRRIQNGDQTAERELFLKYKDAILWKISRRIQTDSENIKDVASEVYVALLEAIRKDSFDPEKWPSLEAFVWGVTNNKIRDWFKKSSRERMVLQREAAAEPSELLVEEHQLETQELKNTLRGVMTSLDTKYKHVLELRYFKEMSIAEISEELGLPRRRVSEHIHYALKLMRKACKKKKLPSIFGVLMLFPSV